MTRCSSNGAFDGAPSSGARSAVFTEARQVVPEGSGAQGPAVLVRAAGLSSSSERSGLVPACTLCADLHYARFERGRLAPQRTFCSACGRALPMVFVEADQPRKKATGRTTVAS